MRRDSYNGTFIEFSEELLAEEETVACCMGVIIMRRGKEKRKGALMTVELMMASAGVIRRKLKVGLVPCFFPAGWSAGLHSVAPPGGIAWVGLVRRCS